MAETIKRAYESEEFSERQQKDINNARARAVRQAWKQEKEYVKDGMGTRDWTPEQQEDLVKNGSVQGYEGHHMRSVSNGKTYDEQMEIAGDKNNIQFLEKTKENNEHIRAHEGDTRNRTNGYYDVKTGEIKDFGDRAPQPPKAEKLSNPVMQEEKAQAETKAQEQAQTQEKGRYDAYGIDMSKAEPRHEQSRNTDRTR